MDCPSGIGRGASDQSRGRAGVSIRYGRDIIEGWLPGQSCCIIMFYRLLQSSGSVLILPRPSLP